MKTTPAICLPALRALVSTTSIATEGDCLQRVKAVGRRTAGDYHALDASGAKTGLPLRELPRSGRVMTRQWPAYALGKLVAHRHPRRNLSVSLDIDNVFDRTYYTSAFQRTWVSPGPGRSATFGLQSRF